MPTYWPENIPRHLEYPTVGVGQLLAAACHLHGDRLAVEDGDLQLTYSQLWEEASAVAAAVEADGVRPGDVVLVHLPNTVWFVVTYLGVHLAGAVVSPVSPLQQVTGLREQIVEVDAVLAISHPAHVGALVEAADGTSLRRIVVVPGSAAAPAETTTPVSESVIGFADWAVERRREFEPVVVDPDALAHLVFTGGTTGVSKGVRTLQRNVVSQITQALAWRMGSLISLDENGRLQFTRYRTDGALVVGETVSLIVGPLYHTQSLLTMCNLICTGATIVFPGRFSPESVLRFIEAKGVTYINGSPSMWQSLLNCPDVRSRDLSSLRAMSSGAAPLDHETLTAMKHAFPRAMLIEGYGLTEGTCLVLSVPGFHGARHKQGSVGQPIPDTEFEIRDADGRRLGAGEQGELWLRGPQIADGYHRHPDKTAEQFVGGWLRTGDMAYADDEGFLFISGRAKDMLVYKGYNVYPRVLEELLTSDPNVDSAAVVGRSDPNAGQIPVAFVVARPGCTVEPDQLLADVATRVLPYQRVREIIVVDALPTSAAGKTLKNELRARLDAAQYNAHSG
ncbi:class I adenylate-forming enzyme family protein [Rhodococcus wratislaviensis]|uniref:Putative fatty-acid--CoA ligase n=1 Tax=Rhodococcus wratislaviensis NBRC 100605 TaxID=1219028 RepID=X0Q722_RHOWR|nr:AMP-binding protein [Rhodococcus wratislaviensis]GAF46496.1 putative fatty-acid--CoA ligase [Rhodococcus wratislaviensis NBRC 100605]